MFWCSLSIYSDKITFQELPVTVFIIYVTIQEYILLEKLLKSFFTNLLSLDEN